MAPVKPDSPHSRCDAPTSTGPEILAARATYSMLLLSFKHWAVWLPMACLTAIVTHILSLPQCCPEPLTLGNGKTNRWSTTLLSPNRLPSRLTRPAIMNEHILISQPCSLSSSSLIYVATRLGKVSLNCSRMTKFHKPSKFSPLEAMHQWFKWVVSSLKTPNASGANSYTFSTSALTDSYVRSQPKDAYIICANLKK